MAEQISGIYIRSAEKSLQYSVDNGANYSDLVSPVTLLAGQDMTQVRVRSTLTVSLSDGTTQSKSTTWSGFPAASGTPSEIKLFVEDLLAFDSSRATHSIYEIWAEVTA